MPFKRFFRHQGSESQGNRTGPIAGNADPALKISAAGRQIAVVPQIAGALLQRKPAAPKAYALL